MLPCGRFGRATDAEDQGSGDTEVISTKSAVHRSDTGAGSLRAGLDSPRPRPRKTPRDHPHPQPRRPPRPVRRLAAVLLWFEGFARVTALTTTYRPFCVRGSGLGKNDHGVIVGTACGQPGPVTHRPLPPRRHLVDQIKRPLSPAPAAAKHEAAPPGAPRSPAAGARAARARCARRGRCRWSASHRRGGSGWCVSWPRGRMRAVGAEFAAADLDRTSHRRGSSWRFERNIIVERRGSGSSNVLEQS